MRRSGNNRDTIKSLRLAGRHSVPDAVGCSVSLHRPAPVRPRARWQRGAALNLVHPGCDRFPAKFNLRNAECGTRRQPFKGYRVDVSVAGHTNSVEADRCGVARCREIRSEPPPVETGQHGSILCKRADQLAVDLHAQGAVDAQARTVEKAEAVILACNLAAFHFNPLQCHTGNHDTDYSLCLQAISRVLPVLIRWYSRPELNRDQRFRKPLLYPFELRERWRAPRSDVTFARAILQAFRW